MARRLLLELRNPGLQDKVHVGGNKLSARKLGSA